VPGWGVGTWNTAGGDYTVLVGTSSADTPLTQTVALSGFSTPGQPGTCSSAQPAPDWVCVNGGWVPPGMAPTTPTPGTPGPPNGPGVCSTGQPAPDWVCVNGGWVPPGLAPGTGTPGTPPSQPGTCSTPQPGADWVCVNGGWVPTDHPAAAPGTSPTPSTNCSTVQPGAGWVCVNGGWQPPGQPVVVGAVRERREPIHVLEERGDRPMDARVAERVPGV